MVNHPNNNKILPLLGPPRAMVTLQRGFVPKRSRTQVGGPPFTVVSRDRLLEILDEALRILEDDDGTLSEGRLHARSFSEEEQ